MADLDFDTPALLEFLRTTHQTLLAPMVEAVPGDGRPLKQIKTIQFATNPDAVRTLLEMHKSRSPIGFVDGGSIVFNNSQQSSGVRRSIAAEISFAIATLHGARVDPEDRLTFAFDAIGYATDNLSDQAYRNFGPIPAGWTINQVKLQEGFSVDTPEAMVTVVTWKLNAWSKTIGI